jgi:TRAP-type uncharacterized transport system substrate-binding protein
MKKKGERPVPELLIFAPPSARDAVAIGLDTQRRLHDKSRSRRLVHAVDNNCPVLVVYQEVTFMEAQLKRLRRIAVPQSRESRVLAVLAIIALSVAAGFWYWNARTKLYHLRLGAGVELKYRKDLIDILCEEASNHDLKIEIQSNGASADAIARVARGELDAAVVPAGLAVQNDDVRQVAVFDCEPLQLFVRPELIAEGVAGLKGKRLNLGQAGGGVRILATQVLDFMGLKQGSYQDETHPYAELITLPPDRMPDGVFSLSPLPSPLGEKMVQNYGYHLMELPYGQAMALRKAAIEDTTVPAHTYGANPAVPDQPLHTVGTRALLVANCNVSKIAIRRMLEVLYESDFSRRAGMPPLSETAILRSVEYPNHAGTVAYLHRHDPWVNKDFVDNIMNLRGLFVSVISAAILFWQWYRRRRVADVNDYLRACAKLEIDALRASSLGEFTAGQLDACQKQLTELHLDVLEKHHAGIFSGDQQFATLLARIDSFQQSLPRLLSAPASEPVPLSFAELHRKAA